jgi:dTDP-glucose 4,6-dehydratase
MNTIYLVTGGAGFIGSNFIRMFLNKYPDRKVVNFDKLTYAGNLGNFADLADNPNYCFVKGDVGEPKDVSRVFEQFNPDYVIHFAAESHVDRSILEPGVFIATNVMGTQVMLDHARSSGVRKFLHVSTDEVYGSLGPEGRFSENSSIAPNSPYSASKAGSDLLARAAFQTHGAPIVITRCSNNYGPYQFPEKLIPLMINNLLNNRELPIYGDGLQVRDWIHVDDHARALDLVLHEGIPGEVYNVGADNEKPNIEIVRLLLKLLGKPESMIRYVKDRPGHDRRYAIDSTKIQTQLGWKPEVDFETGMAATIDWYRSHQEWLQEIVTGKYLEYYRTMYETR